MTVPDHDFAIAILTNSNEGLSAADAIETWALRHYLGLETSTPEPIEVDSSALDAVTGRYERHEGIFDVWRVDDHLHIEYRIVEQDEPYSLLETEDTPPSAMEYLPAGDTVFVAPGGPPLESVVEFLEAPLFGAGDALVPRPILRRGGRIAERTGDAPAGGPTTLG